MPRHGQKSFCCGAGSARMWMEEKLGGPDQHQPHRGGLGHRRGPDRGGLPVLQGHAEQQGWNTKIQGKGAAAEGSVEVVDVAQMLLAAVRRWRARLCRQGPPGRTPAGALTPSNPSAAPPGWRYIRAAVAGLPVIGGKPDNGGDEGAFAHVDTSDRRSYLHRRASSKRHVAGAGWVMSAGTTHWSNWSGVTAPELTATAASRRVDPSRWACLAIPPRGRSRRAAPAR